MNRDLSPLAPVCTLCVQGSFRMQHLQENRGNRRQKAFIQKSLVSRGVWGGGQGTRGRRTFEPNLTAKVRGFQFESVYPFDLNLNAAFTN